jgi:hypothetical protein
MFAFKTRAYSLIWGLISIFLALLFEEIIILHWIFLIFSGMCFYTFLRTIFIGWR